MCGPCTSLAVVAKPSRGGCGAPGRPRRVGRMELDRPWRPDGRDVALAFGTAAFLAVTVAADAGAGDVDALGYLLVVVPALALAARQRAPRAVLGVVLACMLAYQLRDYPEAPPAPLLVAAYTAVRAGARSLTIALTAVVLVVGV